MDRRRKTVYGALAIAAALLGLKLFMARPIPGGPCESSAACFVTPGGSGAANGIDWDNAYAGLPASPTCGVTYYLAGGSYDYTSTSTTISNSCTAESPMAIYKAVAGGPGNPQNVAGWHASFGNTQALFSQATDADPERGHSPFFTLSGTHITLDGVVPASGTPTKRAAFGIHLRSSNRLAFIEVTGANNTLRHIEFDGRESVPHYGLQVTTCSRSNKTVTVTTNGNPPWVVGDKIDLYMNGGAPRDFTTVPPSTGWAIIKISGNQLQYTQGGPDETCIPAIASTVVLNFSGSTAVSSTITTIPANLTLTDSYSHELMGSVHFTGGNGCNGGCSFLRNYFSHNHSTPTQHSNAFDGKVFVAGTIGQNIFEDISGTGVVTPTGGGVGPTLWANDAIYSNLVFCSIASQSAYLGPPTGATWQTPQCDVSSVFSDDNGSNLVTNLGIYGNTIIRPTDCKIWILNASSTATVVNNFLYCPGRSVQISGTGTNHSFNTGWGGAINQAPSPGTGDYFTTTFPNAANVFVDPSDGEENFHLLNDTVDAPRTGCKPGKNCLKDATTLPAPYNVDLIGTPRGTDGTWERGAYQLIGVHRTTPVD